MEGKDPLDEIFVDRFTDKEYRKIEKYKEECLQRTAMPKKIDMAMGFFRKDKSRDTNNWPLFCKCCGFSYSLFMKAFYAVQKERNKEDR